MRWTRPARPAIVSVVTMLGLAACAGPSHPVRADAAASGAPPTVTSSPPASRPPTPSPDPSTAARTGTPTPAATPTHQTRTATPKPGATPRVGRVTISPTDLTAAPCGTLVRPVVTAKVTDADDPPATLQVTLGYNLSATYQGTVRMHYDASRGLFVYRLPGVDAKAGMNTMDGGHLAVFVTVRDPGGLEPRPEPGPVATVEGCPPPIGNS